MGTKPSHVAEAWRNDNTCTLDGKRAKIVGWNLNFGIIATMDGKQDVEFAWSTIARIMSKDRAFRS